MTPSRKKPAFAEPKSPYLYLPLSPYLLGLWRSELFTSTGFFCFGFFTLQTITKPPSPPPDRMEGSPTRHCDMQSRCHTREKRW